ncbi:MAG: 8-amino-7-oxononanoate synthase [bacterium]
MTILDFIKQELEDLKKNGLYREMKNVRTGLARAERSRDVPVRTNHDIPVQTFCSNDYLGLSNHPQIIEAAIKATKEHGTGAGASRLISGNLAVHEELEKRIAKFKDREAALVFSTGYMANVGTIAALTDENDTIIIDRLNHASIIDACKLSKAKLQVYKHCDMQSLESILIKSEKFEKRLIITDSVFSMDGDIAPLPEIVALAKKFKAITMIDEAHATGTIGKTGKGAEEHFNLHRQVDIIMGTLSKALGSHGGFIAGSRELIDFITNKARSFIYTTALPPANAAAAIAALDIIEKDNSLVAKLQDNARFFKSVTPIIPIIIGEAEKTMLISQQLFERGFHVSGIRPPTVPNGESRLRITVSAKHTKEELSCLASLLQELIPA